MNNKLNKNLVVKKSPRTASRIIDGEAVVVLPEEGLVRVLNEVGSFIWKALDGKKKLSEISRALTHEFEVSEEQAFSDTEEFVADLIIKKMLVEVKK